MAVVAMQGGVDFSESQLIEPFKLNVNQDRHLNRLFIWPHLRKGFLLEPLFLIPPLHLIQLRPVLLKLVKIFRNLPIRRAFEKSINVVAVKLNDLVNPKTVVSFAQKSGINSPMNPVLFLPLQ